MPCIGAIRRFRRQTLGQINAPTGYRGSGLMTWPEMSGNGRVQFTIASASRILIMPMMDAKIKRIQRVTASCGVGRSTRLKIRCARLIVLALRLTVNSIMPVFVVSALSGCQVAAGANSSLIDNSLIDILVFEFLAESQVALITLRRNLACLDCRSNGASRFVGMAAIVEFAFDYVRPYVTVIGIQFTRFHVPHGNRADARRIGYVSSTIQGNQFGVDCRMAAFGQFLANVAHRTAQARLYCVEQTAFAHARWPGKD